MCSIDKYTNNLAHARAKYTRPPFPQEKWPGIEANLKDNGKYETVQQRRQNRIKRVSGLLPVINLIIFIIQKRDTRMAAFLKTNSIPMEQKDIWKGVGVYVE